MLQAFSQLQWASWLLHPFSVWLRSGRRRMHGKCVQLRSHYLRMQPSDLPKLAVAMRSPMQWSHVLRIPLRKHQQ